MKFFSTNTPDLERLCFIKLSLIHFSSDPQWVSSWYDLPVETVIITSETLPIFTFSIFIAVGVGLGLFWSVWPVSEIPVVARLRLNTATIGLIGALIGGRFGSVIVNWRYYHVHWIETPQVWLGGISWVGAFSGGMIAVVVAARIYQTPVGKVADNLLPLFTSIVTSAWLASWMTGYAYGLETQAWWGIPARDEWGIIANRWPVQLSGACAALGIHWIVDNLKTRGWVKAHGLAASLELGGFSAIILALSPFYAAPRPFWHGIPIGLWFAIGMLILSLGASVAIVLRARIIQRKSIMSG